MNQKFYKYEAAGNDFVIFDNRQNLFDSKNLKLIRKICDRYSGVGSDGLILLEKHKNLDFEMIYFNSDGSQSGFCANGSRCITHFANYLKIIKNKAKFQASDGVHESAIDGQNVKVKMNDIKFNEIKSYKDSKMTTFIDSGSPHIIFKTNNVNDLDISSETSQNKKKFAEYSEGLNYNYWGLDKNKITLRTFERGVDCETKSCGSGSVALAVLLRFNSINNSENILISMPGGDLQISLKDNDSSFHDIWLSGTVKQVFSGNLKCL